MTFVSGNPVTGFTLELDGDPDAIKRVMLALNRAMEVEVKRAESEHWARIDALTVQSYVLSPRWPFQGALHVRTTE